MTSDTMHRLTMAEQRLEPVRGEYGWLCGFCGGAFASEDEAREHAREDRTQWLSAEMVKVAPGF